MVPSFRPNPLFPFDWYWIADDERVYSSKRQAIVGKDDAAFTAWTTANAPDAATLWARDATGAQTSAALQDVLTPYGLFVDLRAYAASAMQAKLAAGETFNVAASGQTAVPVLCDGTNDTRADLGLLALYGQANPTGTKTWIDNDGVATQLTGAQLVTLTTVVGNWIADCYPALASVVAGVESGKVTTTAQVDQAFAAVSA